MEYRFDAHVQSYTTLCLLLAAHYGGPFVRAALICILCRAEGKKVSHNSNKNWKIFYYLLIFFAEVKKKVFWCFGKNCVCGWMQEAVNSWNSHEPPPCYRLHPYASVRDTACFERHVSSLFWLFMSLTDWHQNEFTSVCSEMFRNHLMKTGEGINIKEHLEGSDDSAEYTPYYYLFLKMRSLHLAVR